MAKNLTKSVMLAIVGLAIAQAAVGQSAVDLGAMSKDVEQLKAGQAALQKDLQEIKSLLQAGQAGQQAPAAARVPAAETVDVVVNFAGSPVKGERNAKVTVVEFTDYQCPFCSRHFRQVWPLVEQEYIKTGKVKLAFRDMPLEALHPQALKAAEAARCAGAQSKYWEMHDRLFADQSALSRKDLSTSAQALGLDVAAFDQCLDSGKEATAVRQDLVEAFRAGAKGTPTFFLGLTDQNTSQIKAVRVLRGAVPFASFKEAIDGLLASAK